MHSQRLKFVFDLIGNVNIMRGVEVDAANESMKNVGIKLVKAGWFTAQCGKPDINVALVARWLVSNDPAYNHRRCG